MKMMLSKAFNEKKVQFPAYVSRKYDGVPVIFWQDNGVLYHATRQGKQLESIPHIIEGMKHWLKNQNKHFNGFVACGELYVEGWPFKDISGKVRKQEPCDSLEFKIFELSPYLDYTDFCVACLGSGGEYIAELDYPISLVDQIPCHTLEEIDMLTKSYMKDSWEGLIVRSGDYEHGKRSWNSMKIKNEPTMDLKVVGFEEAISQEGEPKGMIGAFVCEYKDRTIKVGAGKTSHAERTQIHNESLLHVGRIIEVKYMKDDSYDDLRQPTFQRWRDDKNENDVSYD